MKIKVGDQIHGDNGNTITITGFDKSSRKYKYTCDVCMKDKDLFYKDFVISNSTVHKTNTIPCGCTKFVNWDEVQYDVLLDRVCTLKNITYLGIVGKFTTSVKTKISCICNECGYLWNTTSISNMIHRDSYGCYECKKKTVFDNQRNQNTEQKLMELCAKSKYIFVGYIDGYVSHRSKFKYICLEHGEQTCSYDNFIRGRRCPGCAKSGYDKNKPGFIYIFSYKKNNNKPVYKYGITNRDIFIRSDEHLKGVSGVNNRELITYTYFTDGYIPQIIEYEIKSTCESGVVDWLYSGNSETSYDIDGMMNIVNFNRNKYEDYINEICIS